MTEHDAVQRAASYAKDAGVIVGHVLKVTHVFAAARRVFEETLGGPHREGDAWLVSFLDKPCSPQDEGNTITVQVEDATGEASLVTEL
ncbi:MAG: hypothetical protein JW741_21740 [Sedimentisphaerales bacterium]|nr:hypothetical protein [Sedimentisphaerales bacterium]